LGSGRCIGLPLTRLACAHTDKLRPSEDRCPFLDCSVNMRVRILRGCSCRGDGHVFRWTFDFWLSSNCFQPGGVCEIRFFQQQPMVTLRERSPQLCNCRRCESQSGTSQLRSQEKNELVFLPIFIKVCCELVVRDVLSIKWTHLKPWALF